MHLYPYLTGYWNRMALFSRLMCTVLLWAVSNISFSESIVHSAQGLWFWEQRAKITCQVH